MTVPELVTVTVWGVPKHQVLTAMLRVAIGPRALRSVPGLSFAKLLGTGDARSFAVRDTDLQHWVLVASWETAAAADAFFGRYRDGARPTRPDRTARAWSAIADETLQVRLRPLRSRGRWSGREPFGTAGDAADVEAAIDADAAALPGSSGGPVAAITRARVRPSRWVRFWSAVPPVAADLQGRPGVLTAMGIGEAPVGFQGTFSVWRDADALRTFAYRDAAHAAVVEATPQVGWYAEELFARFAVVEAEGTYRGRPLFVGAGPGSAGPGSAGPAQVEPGEELPR